MGVSIEASCLLCFYGAVDGTIKSWLAQGWNCLVPMVGAWLQTVGEKQASGKAQQSSGSLALILTVIRKWPRLELSKGTNCSLQDPTF